MARRKTTKNAIAYLLKDSIGGLSERDAIAKVNAKKGFIKGNDSVVPPEQPIEESQPKPSAVRGSDSQQPEEKKEERQIPPAAISPKDDGTLEVTHEYLRDLMQKAVDKATKNSAAQIDQLNQKIAQTQQEIDKQKDEFEKKKTEYEDQIEKERKQRDRLANLFTDFDLTPEGQVPVVGDRSTNVYIAPQSMRGGISGRDACREYEKILNDVDRSSARQVITNSGVYVQKDTRPADLWFVENRDSLRKGMEEVAKKNGLLQGRIAAYSGKDAPTTFATLPPALQSYLSSVVRIEHSSRFVLWQFVNRNIAAGVPPGQTTLIPRVKHLNLGTTSTDWLLTPGTPTVTTTQPLTGNQISLPIQEYGMGKDSTVEPVAIADIVSQTNLLDLENLLRDRIGYNYHSFEDLLIFELLLSTTANVYNNKGGVSATAGGVTAGTATAPSGVVTLDFLSSLRAYMTNLKVPPLPDGTFIYVGTPEHIAQIESDQRTHHQYTVPGDVEALNNMFASKTRNEYMGRMRGYKGTICGFQVFEGTSFSNGIAGTPGVQTETLGGTATTTRSGFAMGADAIGSAESLSMELRESDDTNFGRIRSLIWKAHLGMTGLDIDSARTLLSTEVARPVGAEEQLRVFEVRASVAKV